MSLSIYGAFKGSGRTIGVLDKFDVCNSQNCNQSWVSG
jgi:hypothetical protein